MHNEHRDCRAIKGLSKDKRGFIIKSAFFLLGSFFSPNTLSNVLACDISASWNTKPRVSLIIDDIGTSTDRVKMFLDLNMPLTFAVLPGHEKSQDIAIELFLKGHEVMLHQPMEPFNSGLDPGPGAVYMRHNSEEIETIVEKNISLFPFAAGVNNHMGSRFTSSAEKASAALNPVRRHHLYFIDSLTSHRSEAYRVAMNNKMIASRRDVFLDNEKDEDAVFDQLLKLKNLAQKKGRAIGIGHPFHETAKALDRFFKSPHSTDISLVSTSSVMGT